MPSDKQSKILIVLVAIVLVVSAAGAAAILMSDGSAKSSPAANFEADITSGVAPLTIHFTDLSTGSPDQWLWDFNNDGKVDSTEQNPEHTYTEPGTYSVKLIASNTYGSDEEVKVDLIAVSAASSNVPVADFSASSRMSEAPLTAKFTDLSTGSPAQWLWDFGDGGTSTAQNPEHTYSTPGTYTVKLTASNAYGSDAEVKSGYIVATPASTPADQFSYTIDGGNVTITKYNGPGGDVIIPSTIEGLPVRSIGEYAFYNIQTLRTVMILDSVTSISDMAFYYCYYVTSVTIGNGVTSIGNMAFQYCGDITSLTIGSRVTTIGDAAFSSCSSLTSVTIPNSVTYMGNGTFSYCGSLTSITIPNSVTSIGVETFYHCGSLTSVTIGNGVNHIGMRMFERCTSLTSITIPSSVTSIGNNAFSECSALTSVTIPNSVLEIGNNAFYSGMSLTSVTIGSGVTIIGDGVFSDCYALASVTFEGNAPSATFNWALNVPSTMIVYYHPGATGFTNPWRGFQTVQLPS